MPPSSRKRQSVAEAQFKNKRTKNAVESGGIAEHVVESPHSVEADNDQDDQDDQETSQVVSTQTIAEVQTNFKHFIGNTGKNDGWAATFKEHVQQREVELVQQLRAGMLERKQKETSFRQTFRPFLTVCLAPVGVRPCDTSVPFPVKSLIPTAESMSGPVSIEGDGSLYRRHPLLAKTATLINESRVLLNTYASLLVEQQKGASDSSNVSSRQRLIQNLEDEEKAILHTIMAGKRVARTDIDARLQDTRTRSGVDLENGANSQGSKVLILGAAELNKKTKSGNGDVQNDRATEPWRVVAAESIKAIERLDNVAVPPGYAGCASR